MSNFNAKKAKNECVQWIRDWFKENGEGCNAIIGISGGIDSSVTAALCVEALGKGRVIGVMMPNGYQKDIQYAKDLIEHLDIKFYCFNIKEAVNTILYDELYNGGITLSTQTLINFPARIRMATLYAASQSLNGRVANTCNLSEDWIGYSTRYGDAAGDFSPLANFTKTEVRAIAYELGLPKYLIEKTPSDGLSGKSDEESFGFTYEVLDKYIRTGIIENKETKQKIDTMHKKNLFKMKLIPSFKYKELEVWAED